MDKRSLSGSKFIREGAIISVLTMLGKVTGFLREWSFAFFFGTSLIVDAIRIAIDLSTYVFTLLSGRTMEAVFVPLVVRWRTRGLVRSTDLFVRAIAWGGFILSLLLGILLGMFSDTVTAVQVPSYDAAGRSLVSGMIRLIAPSVPLFVSCYLVSYLLSTYHRFRVFALLPIFVNSGLILSALLVYLGFLSPPWISAGYDLSLAVLLAALIIDARGVLPGRRRATSGRLKTILGLFFAQYWPMLTIALFYQTRMFIDKVILSGIDVGMVAAFYYARFIVETPATTVGLAIQRMYLPRFSELAEKRNSRELGGQFRMLLTSSLWTMLPLIVFTATSARTIVSVLFGYGEFDAESVTRTSAALVGWSPGIWLLLIYPIMNRVFNATGENLLLMKYGILGVIINVGLAIFLSKVIGVAGVAIANPVSLLIVLLFLLPKLPGQITVSCLLEMGKWVLSSLPVILVMQVFPSSGILFFDLVIRLIVTILLWIGLSLFVPGGRMEMKRIREMFHTLTPSGKSG